MSSPLISLVIPSYKRLEFLGQCLENAQDSLKSFDHEIIVVHGGYQEGALDAFKFGNVRFIEEGPLKGATAAFDKGFRLAKGQYVAWLNDDSVYKENAIGNMLHFMRQNKKVGVGAFYFNGNDLDNQFAKSRVNSIYGMPYANFGFVRNEVFKRVDYCDLQFEKYGWDPDFSLKVWQAGYQVRGCAQAQVHHFCPEDEVKVTGRNVADEDNQALFNKWDLLVDELVILVDDDWSDVKSYLAEFSDDQMREHFKRKMNAYLKVGRMEDATKYFDQLSGLANKKAIDVYSLASFKKELGFYDEAQSLFTDCLEHSDSDNALLGKVHFHLGEINLKKMSFTKAKENFNLCLEMLPEHEKAKKYLTKENFYAN